MQNADIKKRSLEEARTALLCELIKNSKEPVITKTVPFINNDVPEFLKRLDQFKKESEKVIIVVKTSR
ncbi:MAG: hypothetical protein V1898_02545 [Patescibacteria group bacterium]